MGYTLVNTLFREVLPTRQHVFKFFAVLALSSLLSLNYAYFIFPNSFVPAGVDGICTMVQDVSGINIGYLSFLVNIPLLFVAYRFLNREFAVYTTVFIVVFSVTSVLWKSLGITAHGYYTPNGTSTILAPIASGVLRALIYVFTLKINCCGGGVDIIASVTKKFKPHYDLMYIIFGINTAVSLCSFFVYGLNVEPVICSIIYFFVSSAVSGFIRSSQSEIVRFEIITTEAEKLCDEIINNYHQRATVVDSHGAYSGKNNKVVICVTDKVNASGVEKALLAHSEAVTFKSVVTHSESRPDYM